MEISATLTGVTGEIPSFDSALDARGYSPLVRARPTTLQINLGRLCNQTCKHCHVEAGPAAAEAMTHAIVLRTLTVLAASPGIATVDITGGAPELHQGFRRVVSEAYKLGRHIIDRCNLTVLHEPGMEHLPGFLADHHVEIYASLPCYVQSNVDEQRGPGSFRKSIDAIRILNSLGYGMHDSKLQLNLVYNPLGSYLPPLQEALESEYRQHLSDAYCIEFNRLFTIANMPIGRFGKSLETSNQFESYIALLATSFNPQTLPGLMCRTLISVGADGKLYDCDFNQALSLPSTSMLDSVWSISSFDDFAGTRIATGRHCFGCTAGDGSSCGGSLQ